MHGVSKWLVLLVKKKDLSTHSWNSQLIMSRKWSIRKSVYTYIPMDGNDINEISSNPLSEDKHSSFKVLISLGIEMQAENFSQKDRNQKTEWK